MPSFIASRGISCLSQSHAIWEGPLPFLIAQSDWSKCENLIKWIIIPYRIPGPLSLLQSRLGRNFSGRKSFILQDHRLWWVTSLLPRVTLWEVTRIARKWPHLTPKKAENEWLMSTHHVNLRTFHVIIDISYHVSVVNQSKARTWPP